MYDLIVIGAGPGGYEAAAHAGKMGRKVLLVEKDKLGGTCLHAGCIPTKTFLRSSRLYTECRNARAYGVLVSEPRFDLPAVVARKNRVVGTLARGVETLMKRSGVEVVRGSARLVARDTVEAGGTRHQAENILIATGSRPAAPPIPGIECALDSTSILESERLPERLAIIGGGYIGLEFASFFAAVGTRVTVFEMLPRIAPGVDSDIAARLEQALRKQGVEIRVSCRVTGIDGGTLWWEDDGGRRGTLAADAILNATGRVPVVECLGLEKIGIDYSRKGIRTSEYGKTNVPGVWACGDVTGRRLLAHAATREGLAAVNTMFGAPDRIRYHAVPAVIYTHPEVAAVGQTEDELKAAGIEYRKSALPMGVAGRFLVEHEGAAGFVKVLAGARHGEILGVHAIGDPASEFVVMAAAMIAGAMRARDVAGIVFPHPTVSEALKQAVVELMD